MTAREALAATVPLLIDFASQPCVAVGSHTLRWGPHSDGFAWELSFQLHQRGTGTRSVPVIPHLSIASTAVAAWRRSRGLPPDRGRFFACQLGDLSSRAQGTHWEIGESNRAASAADIMRTLESRALPLIAVLRDPDRASERMATDLWALVPRLRADVNSPPVEYLLAFGREDLVPELIASARTVPSLRRQLDDAAPPSWVGLAREFERAS